MFKYLCRLQNGVERARVYKRQPHKMVEHTQKICRSLPTNCLGVFDNFAGLVLKGLNKVHRWI